MSWFCLTADSLDEELKYVITYLLTYLLTYCCHCVVVTIQRPNHSATEPHSVACSQIHKCWSSRCNSGQVVPVHQPAAGTDTNAGWEANRMFGVALALRHRQWFTVLGRADEYYIPL